jgi:hypothetical protein
LTAPHLLSATAFVVTPRPERYIKQLVSHFENKAQGVGTTLGSMPKRLEARHKEQWIPLSY